MRVHERQIKSEEGSSSEALKVYQKYISGGVFFTSASFTVLHKDGCYKIEDAEREEMVTSATDETRNLQEKWKLLCCFFQNFSPTKRPKRIMLV